VAPIALLGGHRLARSLVAFQSLLLALAVAGFWMTGLSYQWSPTKVAVLPIVFGAWVAHVMQPGRSPADWAIADGLMALLLLLTFTNVAAPLQYVAVALKEPLVDAQLASADRLLGVHVPSIVEWTRARPLLTDVLLFSYYTLLPQFFLPVLVIGLWYRERQTLWEFVFHFHFCASVTIASLAVWPAICAFTFYGFDSLLNQTRFIHQFAGLRAGTFTIVNGDDMEGLISMPSFHIAGALMVTWAFRRYPRWLALLVPLNLLMVASTVMTGAHYFVDVLATVVLFAVSVLVYVRGGVARGLHVTM